MLALIVNPYAGRGRAARRATLVQRALAEHGQVQLFTTRAAGDERRCALAACDAGARVVAVTGGDGSVHHTARGLLDAAGDGPHGTVPLAIFAGGTGNDFVKSLGTPAHDVQAMAARVASGDTRLVDVGLVDDVPFVNAAGLGFDVEVLERLPRGRWLTGTAAYVVTALRALLTYPGYDAALAGDRLQRNGRHLLTVFANGRVFGGTFHIAPNASLDDGRLALVNIGRLPPWSRPGVFVRATRGTHLGHPAVLHETGACFTISAARPLRFEADGELYRARGPRLTVQTRSRALRVVV